MPDRDADPARQLARCQEHNRRLRAVFDSSTDGIWITAADGTVLDLNKASELHNRIRADEVIGQRVEQVVAQGIVDRSASLEVLAHKRQVSFVQEARRTGRHLFVTGVPVFDEDGELFLVVVHERDVTDLRFMQTSMEEDRQARLKAQEALTELNLLELGDHHIVAESKEMRQVLSTALKLARLGAGEILLLGESGTGKGLMAKFIHRHGVRSEGPFIQINCAALPPALFEAELFGHERGAFSGAHEAKAGLLDLARGGTFFLDEVGDMPAETQAKLLKCLDEREYYPLGARTPRRMDCAIVAASNRDLEAQVAGRRFRKDLYYRLSAFTVRIPPLRERPEDLLQLAPQLLETLNRDFAARKRLSPYALSLLQAHPFPGNVRELMNLLKKAVVVAQDDLLDGFLAESLGVRAIPAEEGIDLPRELAALERDLLLRAATRCRSTREMAAHLGLSQPTVVRKLRQHGIRLSGARPGASLHTDN